MSSSITDDVGFADVVAIIYPIQDTTPSIPPTTIKMVSCKTIGLHSESIKDMHREKSQLLLIQKS